MVVSAKGRALIESFEGLRLESYQDQRGIWTIGYGHTAEIKEGQVCTQEEADAWMELDLSSVNSALNHVVTVQINQNQFDALGSLSYNIGVGAFKSSTLLKMINAGVEGASMYFLDWNKINKITNAGLNNRRLKEKALFDTPIGA